MNPADDKEIVRHLRADFASLTFSPAPVLAVTLRGKAIKARRRTTAVGAAVAVVAVLAAASYVTRPAPPPGAVTVNPVNPAAPGGVFASGTADGAPWSLAVRNIAGPGSRRCLAAVMLNGRDGDVLFPLSAVDPSFGNPASLARIPGLPAVSAVFTQVTPPVTRATITFTAGGQIALRPVRVRECGHTFRLAGLVYTARRGISGLATTTPLGSGEALMFGNFSGGALPPGVWLNLDKSELDIAASRQATQLGTGTLDGGKIWQIRSSIGLWGQCYTAILHGDGGLGRSSTCVPVVMPPRTMDLHYVPVPGPYGQFTGYAGLVSPRTARVTVTLSGGKKLSVTPVRTTGRAAIAFVVPPGYRVTRLSLADSAGRTFASITRMPPPAGRQPWPVRGGRGGTVSRPIPTIRASAGVVPAGPAHRVPPGGVSG